VGGRLLENVVMEVVWDNMAWGSRSGEMARCLGKRIRQKAFGEWWICPKGKSERK
jgi:hypothetical protein